MVDATQVTNQLFMLAMAVHESLISVSFMHCFLLCWFFRNRHRVLKPSFFMVLYFSNSNLRICFIDSLLGLDVAWVRFVGRDETCLSDRVIWCCRELFMTTHKSQVTNRAPMVTWWCPFVQMDPPRYLEHLNHIYRYN